MTSSTDPFYVEMMTKTKKVYIVDANMAHMQKSGVGDYKLTVDRSSPRIEVAFKRICECDDPGHAGRHQEPQEDGCARHGA